MASIPVADVFITREDLEAAAGKQLVAQLFQKAGSPAGTLDEDELERILENASSHASALVRSAWEEADLPQLANDPAFRMHVAWIGMEFKAEEKQWLNASDGKGKYWAQATRAEAFLKAIAQATLRTAAEKKMGEPAEQASNFLRPTLETGATRFIFAKDPDTGRFRGGF